jgi:fibronectin type 3 domain-containing protein
MSTKNSPGVFAAALGALIGLQGGLLGCGTAGDATEGTTEDEVALPPPTNLTVTVVSSTRMDLSWDATPGATKYIIFRGPSPGTETTFTSVPVTPTTFAYNHLAPNTTYCWEVANLNATNEVSGASNEVCAATLTAPTAPEPPTNVTATATSSSRITVSWTGVVGATAYFVDLALAPGPPTFRATVLPPATSYIAAGLTPNTTYVFDVRAQTSAGISAPSTQVSATTFVSGLEGYWRLDESSGTVAMDISGFNRHGTLSGGATFSSDKPNVLDNKSTVDIPAAGGKITVPNSSALNLVGTPYSVLLWVKVPVAATEVHIIGQRNTDCGAVGWEIAQDATNNLSFTAGANVRGFGSPLPIGTWTHVAVTSDGTTLVQYLNGIQTATSLLTVSSHGALPLDLGHVGDCGGGEVRVDEVQIYSRALSAAEVAALGTLPAPPQNLTVSVQSSTQQSLAWTAVPDAAKYLVSKGTAAGNETFFTSSPATSPTFIYGHLDPGTQYSWRVAVVKGGLFSNPSNEVIASTFPGPTVPTNMTATAVSSSRIRVDWTAVSGAVFYQVYQSVSGGPFTFLSTTSNATFTAAGLTSMTPYSYEVRALDSGNTLSPFSVPASATTL